MKNLFSLLVVGTRESESSDGCVVKEGSQVVDFVNFRVVEVEMDGRLIQIPEGSPFHGIPVESR